MIDHSLNIVCHIREYDMGMMFDCDLRGVTIDYQ